MELNGKDYTKNETGCAEVARSTVVFIYFIVSLSYTPLITPISFPPSLSLPFFVSQLDHQYMRKLGQHVHKTDNKYLDS